MCLVAAAFLPKNSNAQAVNLGLRHQARRKAGPDKPLSCGLVRPAPLLLGTHDPVGFAETFYGPTTHAAPCSWEPVQSSQ